MSAERLAAEHAARAATEAREKRAKESDSAALDAYRQWQELRASNPFVAAQFHLENASQVARGHELHEVLTTPEPPKAA